MKYIYFVLLSITSMSASANYYCTGKIAHLGTSTSSLYVNNGYGVHVLCDLSTDG